MSERWLLCAVSPGMFSDELAVTYRPGARRVESSFFVPRDAVRGNGKEQGRVRVSVFHEGPTAWAVLPDDTRTIIAVDESDLGA